jgi:AP-1-like factor
MKVGHSMIEERARLTIDSDSDAPTGHDGKRQHQNDKPTKKGGRKSFAGDEERPGKEMSKAARRKEQNRAAQKAFRERREARVTDVRLSFSKFGLRLIS